MEKTKIAHAANLVLRLVLAGLFLYAGGSKLADPSAFQVDIFNFAILPWAAAGVAAVYLPWLEILCAGALIARKPAAGLLLTVLMVVFTLAIATAWGRGLEVSCGCFGATDGPTNYPLKLTENFAILAGLGAWLWLEFRQENGPPHAFADESVDRRAEETASR
jgi:putative oxidoreductase